MKYKTRFILIVTFIFCYYGCGNSNYKQQVEGSNVLNPILNRELNKFISYIDSVCDKYEDTYSYYIYIYKNDDHRMVRMIPFVNPQDIEFYDSKRNIIYPINRGYFRVDSTIIGIYEQEKRLGVGLYDSLKLCLDTVNYKFPPSKMEKIMDMYYSGGFCGIAWVYDIINDDSIVFNREIRIQ